MFVRFWGVRGSIPTPMQTSVYQRKLARVLVASQETTFSSSKEIAEFSNKLSPELRRVVGGNTSCVEIYAKNGEKIIFDAGSGARDLGDFLIETADKDSNLAKQLHIIFSHTHWDHILGFPFCKPLYEKDWDVYCYGAHSDLEDRLRYQHDQRHFPVPFDTFVDKLKHKILTENESSEIAGFSVTPGKLDHPGDSFAYRVERDDEVIIYATDGAFRNENIMQNLNDSEFFKDADAIIFDSMLTFEEVVDSKKHWGHSAPQIGVDLCLSQNIKRLVLFHHNPDLDDTQIFDMLEDTMNYKHKKAPGHKLQIDIACEGWEFPAKPQIVPN